jgi:trk system potassium uptake protein TrkH
MDALFTSTSAVTGTGLVVVGTGSYYNLFGQLVLLILFQIGGLGYMTLIVFIMTLLGQKLSLQGGMLMQQSLAGMSRGRIYIFVRRVIYFTLAFQGVGAAAIALRLWSLGEHSLPYSLYAGVFHAVSAFCTAGFSLWDSSFVAYQNDVWLNVIINSLSISGAIGFLVLHESIVYYQNWRQGKRHYLSIHTRLALIMTVALSLVGTVLIAIVEYDPGQNLWSLFLTASFQTISASSTAGFNTIDLAQYSDTSQAILALLMFIGAPAGGTGGGIKATTFAVLLLSLRAMVQGNWDVNVFRRRIPMNTLINTIGVVITGTLWLLAATLVLTVLEPHSFLPLVFELASALGTTGLSLGITPLLSDGGKLVVVLTMLVGRVGPLSVAFSLARQRRAAAYRLPSEEVWVG